MAGVLLGLLPPPIVMEKSRTMPVATEEILVTGQYVLIAWCAVRKFRLLAKRKEQDHGLELTRHKNRPSSGRKPCL